MLLSFMFLASNLFSQFIKPKMLSTLLISLQIARFLQLVEKTVIFVSMISVIFIQYLETKTVLHEFKPAGWNNVGHDNRVFALKFIDDHTVISGGWDSVVHIWDVRNYKNQHHFYGPNISGESLDY